MSLKSFYHKAAALFIFSAAVLHAETYELGEILVKGELQERTLEQALTSAVVIPGSELDESTDSDLYDLIGRIPGVNAIYGEKGFAIRGMSEDGAVNVTLDGIALPSEIASFLGPYSTWDLEQVEVLRGAQSTQIGRNAIAGAVNLRTADPNFRQTVKLRLNSGSRKSRNIALTLNKPLLKDVLALRISGETQRTDGWVKNPTLGKDNYDARKFNNGRIKLLYTPNDKLRAVLGYHATDSDAGGDFIDYATWPEHRYNSSNEEATQHARHRLWTLDLDYRFNEQWQLKSLTGYDTSTYRRAQDYDMTVQDHGRSGLDEDGNTFSQELKLLYHTETLRSAFGFYYTRLKTDTAYSVLNVPGGSLDSSLTPLQLRADVATAYDETVENKALFGEIEYDFNPHWTLIVGARYDIESLKVVTKMSGRITDPGFTPPAWLPGLEARINTNAQKSDTDYSAFLPKIGLLYHIDANNHIGINYQKGYRAGGTDINEFTQKTYDFKPEFTDTFELSYRSHSADNATQLSANLFYTKWKDMQVIVQGVGSPYNIYIDNSGASTLYGGELSATHRFSERLQLFLTAAYVKTKYDTYLSMGEDYSGKQFSFAPELSVTFGGSYYFYEHWFLSGDINYYSESYTHPSNDPASRIAPYTLANAKFGYETEQWSAFLYGRNLTDKAYATDYIISDAEDRILLRSGEPRFIGIQLNLYL